MSGCDYAKYQIIASKKIDELINELISVANMDSSNGGTAPRPCYIEIDYVDVDEHSETVDVHLVFHYGSNRNDVAFYIKLKITDCKSADVIYVKTSDGKTVNISKKQ